MTAERSRVRSVLFAAALIAGLVGTTAACDSETSADSAKKASPKSNAARSRTTWKEPASYTYTLTSSEQVLAGTFRVTVRDGNVVRVVGLDDSSRQMLQQTAREVPKIGGLLGRLEQARRDQADTAEVRYAADGHPLRIALDRDKNAIDDEALYVISGYEPAGG
jgi:hypothetical protein